MNEILSVRVRSNNINYIDDNTDIKVTIFNKNEYRSSIGYDKNNRIIWKEIEYSSDRYINYSDNDIINDFIRINTIIRNEPLKIIVNNEEVDYYSIIQNPYDENAPIYRNYGLDPYYINNGSSIYVVWEGDTKGFKWSKNDGSEILYINELINRLNELNDNQSTQNANLLFQQKENNIKWAFILNGKSKIYYGDIFSDTEDNKKTFSGLISDSDIINEILNKWNSSNNSNITLCAPNNTQCNLIEYNDPNSKLEKPSENRNIVKKKKMNVILASNSVKVKDDLGTIKIYLGDIPNRVYEFDEELGEEFTENYFIGNDELPPYPTSDDANYTDLSAGNSTDISPSELNSYEILGETNETKSAALKAVKNVFNLDAPKSGRCARYTYNMARNYINYLMGGKDLTKSVASGGNAFQEGYFKALEELGYKRYTFGRMSKSQLKERITKLDKFSLGDIICYKAFEGNQSEGAFQYGHTQFYIGGLYEKGYKWSTSTKTNYGSNFVYNSFNCNDWGYVIFRAPRK